MSDAGFAEFIRRIRAGDAQAAEELVRRYESAIRIAVRTRMTDPALKRHFDSMDICQSVLASFYLRAGAGEYDLAEPAQLVARWCVWPRTSSPGTLATTTGDDVTPDKPSAWAGRASWRPVNPTPHGRPRAGTCWMLCDPA
jgi:hypothetical protein